MLCNMCGKEGRLSKTSIEGTTLNVCPDCAKYGTKVNEFKDLAYPKSKKFIEEGPKSINIVLPNFASIIKSKRESLGLTQEQLAKRLNEKESLIQSIEKGRSPNINFAKKIERNLNISLIKEYTESHEEIKVDTTKATIGNMIKFKVRKKK